MKRYLLTAMVLASSTAMAVPDYTNCTSSDETELCQAYLAGVSHGKAATTTVLTEQDDSFRSRALEQRVGERYRKTLQDEKKAVQATN
ncbi:hypothetical protein L4D00_05385 [Photobacterium swingsii]|uniref:Uncharacterized protein n=1 Tax=Photobacterium swingsii TaxID=680026 RepID=A0A0J8Y0I9_9GAMM|nr:hypothetical protein [Photobacterium swingsii]KMV31144.1 hypothetical protein AB733_06260 [Photobacterium swingsii]PSW24245.1 hypothetical protein C9I94_13015 [Photobacterium swingsii]